MNTFRPIFSSNEDCEWLIEAENITHMLRLEVTDSAIEYHTDCVYDVAEVYDGKINLEHPQSHSVIYYTRQKKNAVIIFLFYFSELEQIIQLFPLYSSVAQSSYSLCLRKHLLRFKSESVISPELRNGSKLNVTDAAT